MLYDILIIDDDFLPESKVPHKEQANADLQNQEGTKGTLNDNHGTDLLLKLINQNHRVTFFDGDLNNLINLISTEQSSMKLSSIKFIICDIYLQDLTRNTPIKTIASTISSIISQINPHIKEEEVTIYLNTKYNDNNNRVNLNSIIQVIKENLNNDKYKIEILESKNILNTDQVIKLNDALFKHYKRSLIIDKHIELDLAIFNKISGEKHLHEYITFDNKIRCLNYLIKDKKSVNNKLIQIFNKFRNDLAHKKDSTESEEKYSYPVKDYKELIGCLGEIDETIKAINGLKKD